MKIANDMIPKEAIIELQEIYLREYDKSLDDDKATTLAYELLDFFKVVGLYAPKRRDNVCVANIVRKD